MIAVYETFMKKLGMRMEDESIKCLDAKFQLIK